MCNNYLSMPEDVQLSISYPSSQITFHWRGDTLKTICNFVPRIEHECRFWSEKYLFNMKSVVLHNTLFVIFTSTHNVLHQIAAAKCSMRVGDKGMDLTVINSKILLGSVWPNVLFWKYLHCSPWSLCTLFQPCVPNSVTSTLPNMGGFH